MPASSGSRESPVGEEPRVEARARCGPAARARRSSDLLVLDAAVRLAARRGSMWPFTELVDVVGGEQPDRLRWSRSARGRRPPCRAAASGAPELTSPRKRPSVARAPRPPGTRSCERLAGRARRSPPGASASGSPRAVRIDHLPGRRSMSSRIVGLRERRAALRHDRRSAAARADRARSATASRPISRKRRSAA